MTLCHVSLLIHCYDGHLSNDVKFAHTLTEEREGVLKLSCYFPLLGPGNAQSFLPWHGSALPLVVRTCIAGSGDSALYCFGDRRCANRQRHLVIDEGELMGENILPDLGIQEALTSNQSIHRTE
jgi:hypothetical protein